LNRLTSSRHNQVRQVIVAFSSFRCQALFLVDSGTRIMAETVSAAPLTPLTILATSGPAKEWPKPAEDRHERDTCAWLWFLVAAGKGRSAWIRCLTKEGAEVELGGKSDSIARHLFAHPTLDPGEDVDERQRRRRLGAVLSREEEQT
jgi:hypothetical protein